MTQNNLFRYPKILVNDIEGFLHYYKIKFPRVVEKYEKLIKDYHNNPEELRSLCIKESKEMMRITAKFVKVYPLEKIEDLDELVRVEQRMNKLSCFKFWIYNYLLCEGPLQTFHIEKIREFAERISNGDTAQDREEDRERIEHILIQTDYTDFYVYNLLSGMRIYELLHKFEEFMEYTEKLKNSKNMHYKELNKISEDITRIVKEDKKYKKLLWELEDILRVCDIQRSYFPLTSVIRLGFEYQEKARKHQEEHKELKKEIKIIFRRAEEKLSAQDFDQLKKSYEMLRLLAECKDLFGESDTLTLPFWFSLLKKIAEKLGKGELALGQGSSYYSFVWHLPDELKGVIYNIDNTEFREEELFGPIRS